MSLTASLQTHRTGAYYGPIDFGLYSVKVISTDNSVQRLRNKKLNKTKCDFLGQIRLVRSSPDSPWGGFSGGLSENECKYLNERDHKIYTASQSMGRQVNFFFPTWKVVPGAYSDQRETPGDTWNTPKKWFFCPRKRAKEWRDATFMKE